MILRFRAFLIGAALCATIGTSAIYANTIIRGSFVAWCFSNPIALFFFFYLVLGNILVGLAARRLSLRREELVLIFAMMFVSASLPTFGLVEHLLPMITGVFYYATPENGWVDLIQPMVPGWIAPSEEGVIRGFYEGLPQGEGIPWGGWMVSLSAWLLFLLSLHLVSICLMVLLRKQWIQGERLLYPMMQAPIELVASEQDSGPMAAVPPLLRRSLFWIGFALPVVIGSINGLSHYSPYFRGISMSAGFTILGVSVPMQVSFSLLGFSYFISQPLGLGIWVFYLLTIIERGAFYTLGIASTEKLGWFSNPEAPYLTHQALGAMLMFALFTLWKARTHLRQVVRKAFTGDPGIDDSEEVISYRGAVFGIVGGLAVMTAWLNAAGIPLWVVPLFLAVAFLIFIALSRIVVEAGVALVRAPLIAPDFIMASMGVSRLGGSGLTGLAYCYPWTADIVTFPMASVRQQPEADRGDGGGAAAQAVLLGDDAGNPGDPGLLVLDRHPPVVLVRRHQPARLVVALLVGVPAHLSRADAEQYRDHRLLGLDVHPLRRRHDVAADDLPAALRLLAPASPRPRHGRHGVHFRRNVVQRVSRLADQGLGAEVRRQRRLQEPALVLHRHDPGGFRRLGNLARHRPLHRHDQQLRPRLAVTGA